MTPKEHTMFVTDTGPTVITKNYKYAQAELGPTQLAYESDTLTPPGAAPRSGPRKPRLTDPVPALGPRSPCRPALTC